MTFDLEKIQDMWKSDAVIDPDNLKGSPLYDTNGDYRDYVDLYELLETL